MMPLTEAQKRAKAKYLKSEKGFRVQMRANTISFIRTKASLDDLEAIIKESEKRMETIKKGLGY